MINDADHMNCHSDIDGDLIECKDIDASHEDDWDYDYKKDLECESGSHTTSTPKSNLEEVIDLVIQDAIDYANSPEDKRVLPILTRKPTKGKSKTLSTINLAANHAYPAGQNLQQQVPASNNSGLLLSANINSQSPFHPLMQQNLTHNMQHMLQLAATGKGPMQLSGQNTTASSIQHVNSVSQPQQQITNAMMGFSAAQLPNMIIPSYNSALPSNYSQQTQNSQYSLPVSLSQIQIAQQQQSQLMLGQNSFTDLSTTSNNQQNLNFGTSGISSANVQLMQSSYGNFGSNSSISVSPYQMPGMIQGYAAQSVTDNSQSHLNATQSSIANLSSNPTSASCFVSSKSNPGNNALLNNSSTSSNPNSSSSAAAAAASLYQTNIFDLQQTQLYAQQRLLQAQQQQHQQSSSSSSNSPGLFPDYAAVMARYGAYH